MLEYFTLLQLFLVLGVISLVSFVGAITIGIKSSKLESWLEPMVAFAVGALLGDVFIHLLPELVEEGFSLTTSIAILFGIISFFVLEKIIHWHHCHSTHHEHGRESFTYMSLFADALHNMIDGIILAGAFLSSPVIGISTAIAIVLHELPQEIGDFSVLIKGGFSKSKALLFNFVISLTAFVGAIAALAFASIIQEAQPLLIAFAVGGFLYLAGTDLLPELHKNFTTRRSIIQLIFILLGVAIMASLILIE